MKNYIFLPIAILVFGCANLKKQATKTVAATAAQIQQEEQQWKTETVKQILVDSNENNFEVTIWPKGVLKFNTTNGFEGEAYKISVSAKAKQHLIVNQTQQNTALKNSSLKFKQQERVQAKTTLKTKQQFSFWPIGLVLLGLVISFGYWFYKHKLF